MSEILIFCSIMAIITPESVESIVQSVNSRNLTTGQRIAHYSELFLGIEYYLGPLGEGENGFPDDDPLCDFTKVDCVTFCEQVFALALTECGFSDFLEILNHIRYKEGIISFETRNHYSYIDWLPANSWLCKDITGCFHATCSITKTIDRHAFLTEHGCSPPEFFPATDTEIIYIDKSFLAELPGFLEDGDLIMIVSGKPGIDIAHWGFYVKEPCVFRHASMSRKTVTDLPWSSFTSYIRSKDDFIGVTIVRVVEYPCIYWRAYDSSF